MAETDNGAAPQAAPIKMQVLAQYIRDLSFENVVAQKGLQGGDVQPDIQVQVSLDARKRAVEHQYEIITKFKIQSRNKANNDALFLMELEYAGIFHVENVPEEQMHPFLLIECPRMLFPFVRRIVSDMTRDGGFPMLNLDNVDFLALYRQELARRAEAQAAALKLFIPQCAVAQFRHKGSMGGGFFDGDARRQRGGARSGAPAFCGVGLAGAAGVQAEIRLTAADQFQIDLGQNFAIQQRAVFFTGGIVDAETAAQRIQRGPRAREFLAGNHHGIDSAAHRQRREVDCNQFGIQEFHVKRRVMDHHLRIGEKVEKRRGDGAEQRLIAQEIIAQPMNRKGIGWHGALRVDVLVIGFTSWNVVPQLDRADFHDAVSGGRVQPGGFGIEHDFTHEETFGVAGSGY